MNPPRAAYIHVPFCARRCGYCNFTLVAGRGDLVAPYLAALERELQALGEPREVDTLFFGGGTPTQLPPADFSRLCELTRRWFPLAAGGEFSVEGNPADVHSELVAAIASAGVTRVSLGAQSFAAAKLRALERDHTAADIARAVELLRPNVKSLALDLIFAAPGETAAGWRGDLADALALRPDHLSTYGLTYERGTTYWGRRLRGELTPLDEELERAMYAAAIDTLAAAGYEHYEISNFARPGHRCRHNETYWAGEEYFAAGPGAAGYVAGRRAINHRSTTTYIDRVLSGRSPIAEEETLSPEDRARELLVIGLRRLAGVERAEFQRRTGFALDELVGPALARHVEWGMLAESAGRIHLTRAGLFISDAIWPAFLRR